MRHDEDNLELAEEHVKLARELINEESKKCDPDTKRSKEISEAAFALEKAESEVEDVLEIGEDDVPEVNARRHQPNQRTKLRIPS